MVLINRTDRKYWSQAEGDQYWIDVEQFTQQQQAKTMQLSTYQQAVLDAIKQRITANERPLKGLLIEALAGSGKSTQLWLIAQVLNEYGYTPSECRFVVFGKKNRNCSPQQGCGIVNSVDGETATPDTELSPSAWGNR